MIDDAPMDLFAKYDRPVPRYTSYPTVPQWHTTPTTTEWIASLGRAARAPGAGLALYVHVPFCESLCSFCGCNNVITRDHSREAPYVEVLLAELDIYLRHVPDLPRQPFRQLHLGGGTPTFLSEQSLTRLVAGIEERLPQRSDDFEASVEVDPRVTSVAQLQVLRAHGFRRLSLGVQDVHPEVQHLVNRMQPIDQTNALVAAARELGYASINLDLIYGLPGQTPDRMADLARAVLAMAPDRLAVYSFARVPWIRPAQRRFRDDQIPVGADKRRLYETIRGPLIDGGYLEIGLDHFARPHDTLAAAAAAGTLHRNFMGYTEVRTTTLVGLGVSAISETPGCYHQNEKVLPTYERRVAAGELPTLRGHVLSADDRKRRHLIAELMTRFEVRIEAGDDVASTGTLESLLADGLIERDGPVIRVPPKGRPFLRNAATVFDAYLPGHDATGPVYSRSM